MLPGRRDLLACRVLRRNFSAGEANRGQNRYSYMNFPASNSLILPEYFQELECQRLRTSL
jgi:hypothetical protein